jgi:ATP-dependent Clp protease protease subunit
VERASFTRITIVASYPAPRLDAISAEMSQYAFTVNPHKQGVPMLHYKEPYLGRGDEEDDDHECPSKAEAKPDDLRFKLLQTRTIIINGAIDQPVAEKVMAQLLILDSQSHEPIRIYVTSQGGHVDSGLAIHDMIRFIASPVYTIGAGWVASIAVPILFGAKKANRFSLPHTRYLIHQPSGGAGGQAADIRIEAQEILKLRERLNQLIADETGQPVEKIKLDSDRNFWMNAEEAIKYGIVSKVVTQASDLP